MAERKRIAYRRRIRAILDGFGEPRWSMRHTNVFLRRLERIKGDTITEPDLRVLVRLFNREIG